MNESEDEINRKKEVIRVEVLELREVFGQYRRDFWYTRSIANIWYTWQGMSVNQNKVILEKFQHFVKYRKVTTEIKSMPWDENKIMNTIWHWNYYYGEREKQ